MSGVDADGIRVLSAGEKMKARKPKAGARARFDVTALRKLAGAKVFERGEDYHADGLVKALTVYAKLVEEHARFGRYEETVRLIKRMAGLQDAAEQAAYLADLKEGHRRKRNFMKLL
jgi:uncharacterized Zn finger protein